LPCDPEKSNNAHFQLQTYSASLICLLLCAVQLLANEPPFGDQYPNVKVENGNFVIYFTNNKIESEIGPSPLFRVVYSPTGELLAPRHERPDLPREKYEYDWKGKAEAQAGDETISFSTFVGDQPPRSYIVTKAGKTEQHRLAWSEGFNSSFESIAADAKSICVMAWSGKTISLNHFERDSFNLPTSVTVGEPATISFLVRSPVVSNLIQIRDRYCFGWIRWNRDMKKYETVISTWRPGEAQTSDLVLDEISDWNAYLSMAAIDDRVCLAYHCSINGDYMGFGKIVTVFRKIAN
jgi:hypothetical protein